MNASERAENRGDAPSPDWVGAGYCFAWVGGVGDQRAEVRFHFGIVVANEIQASLWRYIMSEYCNVVHSKT